MDNIFYFTIFLIITNIYNTTFIQFLLICIFFKGGEIYIYIYKIMLTLNMFIYKSFYEKKEKEFQDIIVVQMYEIMKIQIHFWSNYLIFWFKF